MAIKCIKPHIPVEVNVINQENLLQLYHDRFGHQNKQHVKTIMNKELHINVKMDTELCEGCSYGKAHRFPLGTREKATKPRDRVHTDVCSPFQSSVSGYRYFVLFREKRER